MGTPWVAPQFNLAGIALFENEGIQWVPSGDYKGIVTEMEGWKKKGETAVSSVLVRCKITDGPQAGKSVAKFPGLTVNEGNARTWKSIYASAGYAENGLEGTLQPHESHLIGKVVYFHVDSPPASEAAKIESKDIDVNFLRPSTYTERMKNGGGNQQQTPAAPAFTPSSPPPGLPQAPAGAQAAPPPAQPQQTLAAPPPPGGGGPLFAPPPAAGASPPPPPSA